MATIRQYFETDFDYCLRMKVKYDFGGESFECAVLYDANVNLAFFAAYFPNTVRPYQSFQGFIASLKYGESPLSLNFDGGIVLPKAKLFPGLRLRVENKPNTPPEIQYLLLGDTVWRNLLSTPTSRRIYFYSESSLSPAETLELQSEADRLGHELIFRSEAYSSDRNKFEKPLAFICHDSRDKESIARPIALNLQKKICPVWYDEFSLKLGDNLRQSIEKGLKECKRCVLVLSPNFFANNGWGKKEFESIFTREIIEETPLVLPIWCGVTREQVFEYSPSLANVKGADWKALGEDEVCRLIYFAVTSD